jgi:ferredoxin-NADP reductase
LPEGTADWRHYSLINLSTDKGATDAPREHVIAVGREDEGRGGSRYMHERVQEGDLLASDIDHRDYFRSREEKASGRVMQICISRARGHRLVLDI